VTPEDAFKYVAGFCVANDVTARDLQARAKAAGHPWVLGKCWDTFCPVSDMLSLQSAPHPVRRAVAGAFHLTLSVDGEVRQSDTTSNMLYNVAELISYISGVMTLHGCPK